MSAASVRSIQYKAEFKVLALKENQGGKCSAQTFIENGFDLEMMDTE